jgi:hypothetical protein
MFHQKRKTVCSRFTPQAFDFLPRREARKQKKTEKFFSLLFRVEIKVFLGLLVSRCSFIKKVSSCAVCRAAGSVYSLTAENSAGKSEAQLRAPALCLF